MTPTALATPPDATDAVEQRLDAVLDALADAVAAGSDGPAPPPMPKGPVRLGQRLVGENLVSPEDLGRALELQAKRGMKLGETLLEMGVATEEDLLPHIAAQLGVPALRLREGLIDPQVVRTLDREFCERYGVLALFNVRGVLTVALDDPSDLDRLDQVERVTGLRTRPIFAFAASIERMIRRAFEDDFQVDTVTADMDESAVELQADIAD
ncbi:MAG: hypothetical protein AAF805_05435, partial [Planctomycetota bacterium]